MFGLEKHDLSLRYAYWVLLCVICVNLLWIGTTRVTLIWSPLWRPLFETGCLAALGAILATPTVTSRVPRLSIFARVLLFGIVFLNLAWVNLRILNHLTMTTALPYQDALLSTWDGMIGFDWLSYFQFVHERPALSTILDISYTSLTPLSVTMLIVLVLLGLHKRAFFFFEIFFFTAVITMAIGLFFPAEAAVIYNNIQLTDFPNFPDSTGVYHMTPMEALRAQTGTITIHPRRVPGLVTFPSFHTAAGILMCVAAYRNWIFVPVAIYAVVMIASTPIFGGHYDIDLIAGTALALAVSFVLLNTRRYKGVLEPGSFEDTISGLLRFARVRQH